MLHFFSKKIFLKDFLEDFVDIHSHILPGNDDGAKNIKESISLIQAMQDLGIKQFIPTPHIMQDFYPNTSETIGNSYESLLNALDSKTLSNITINPAAEYMLDNHFESHLENGSLFALKGNYVFVEMSYFQPPINLEEIIFKLKNLGYHPIIAHPERYVYYNNKKEYYKRLKQLGCFFQMNLLSLSDHYGNSVEKTANYLINEKLIDFVATDIHNMNHIEKLSNLKLAKNLSQNLTSIIEETNNFFSVI